MTKNIFLKKLISATYCLLTIIFISLTLLSCADDSGTYVNVPDTSAYAVTKAIPRQENGEVVSDYRIAKEYQKVAGLDSLEKGYDSIQIRIWGGHSQSLESHILIVSYNKKWQAKLITIAYAIDSKSRSHKFNNKRSRIVRPASGWEAFVKKLFDLRVYTLPDMSQLGLSSGEDGVSYTVEVGTKNSYRFYSYWSPEMYQDEYPSARSMYNIIQLVETEFGFRYTPIVQQRTQPAEIILPPAQQQPDR